MLQIVAPTQKPSLKILDPAIAVYRENVERQIASWLAVQPCQDVLRFDSATVGAFLMAAAKVL